jgi:hypothetical protein
MTAPGRKQSFIPLDATPNQCLLYAKKQKAKLLSFVWQQTDISCNEGGAAYVSKIFGIDSFDLARLTSVAGSKCP